MGRGSCHLKLSATLTCTSFDAYGYYNIERMLKPIVRKGEVILCGTCMDARGIKDDEVIDGARRGTMIELTDLTIRAEKVIVF